jgi:hypothetical protein
MISLCLLNGPGKPLLPQIVPDFENLRFSAALGRHARDAAVLTQRL